MPSSTRERRARSRSGARRGPAVAGASRGDLRRCASSASTSASLASSACLDQSPRCRRCSVSAAAGTPARPRVASVEQLRSRSASIVGDERGLRERLAGAARACARPWRTPRSRRSTPASRSAASSPGRRRTPRASDEREREAWKRSPLEHLASSSRAGPRRPWSRRPRVGRRRRGVASRLAARSRRGSVMRTRTIAGAMSSCPRMPRRDEREHALPVFGRSD